MNSIALDKSICTVSQCSVYSHADGNYIVIYTGIYTYGCYTLIVVHNVNVFEVYAFVPGHFCSESNCKQIHTF